MEVLRFCLLWRPGSCPPITTAPMRGRCLPTRPARFRSPGFRAFRTLRPTPTFSTRKPSLYRATRSLRCATCTGRNAATAGRRWSFPRARFPGQTPSSATPFRRWSPRRSFWRAIRHGAPAPASRTSHCRTRPRSCAPSGLTSSTGSEGSMPTTSRAGFCSNTSGWSGGTALSSFWDWT